MGTPISVGISPLWAYLSGHLPKFLMGIGTAAGFLLRGSPVSIVLTLILLGGVPGASALPLDGIVLPGNGAGLGGLLASLAAVGWLHELVRKLTRLMRRMPRQLANKSHYSHANKLKPPLERDGRERHLSTSYACGHTLEKMRNSVINHAKYGRAHRQQRARGVGGKPDHLAEMQMAWAHLLSCLGVDASPAFFWTLVYLMFYGVFKELEEEDSDDDNDFYNHSGPPDPGETGGGGGGGSGSGHHGAAYGSEGARAVKAAGA